MKLKLKICAAINIVLSLYSVFVSGLTAKTIILAITGVTYFIFSDKSLEWLKKRKLELIGIGLINIFVSIISCIITIYSVYTVDNEKETKNDSKKLTQEQLKISNIMKLGIAVVLISGMILATTNAQIITNSVKIISLLIFAFIFLLLSKYNEEKLNYKSGTLSYWLIAMLFIIFTFISIFKFEMFGITLSFTGKNKGLSYLILSLIVTLISYITEKKFKDKEFKYITILSLFVTYITLFIFLQIEKGLIVLAIGLLITAINLYEKKTNNTIKLIKKTFDIITYVYAFYLLFNHEIFNNSLLILNVSLCIGNMAFLTFNRKDSFHNYLAPILTNLLICTNLYNYIGITKNTLNILIFTALTIAYVYFYFIGTYKKERIYNKIYQLSYNFFAIIEIIKCLNLSAVCLIINVSMYMMSYLFITHFGKEKRFYEIEYNFLPCKILIYMIGTLSFINQTFLSLTYVNIFNISFTIMLLCYIFCSDRKLKYNFYMFSILTLICALLVNLIEVDKISSITILLGFLLIYYICKSENGKKYKESQIYNFGFILCSLYLLIVSCNIFSVPMLLRSSTLVGIYIVIAIVNRKKNKWYYLLPIILIVPCLNTYLNALWFPKEFGQIITNLYMIFAFMFIIEKLVKKEKEKQLLNNIGLFLIISSAILKMNLIINIYVFVLGIIIFFVSMYEKKYNHLYYLSIGISILSIISALSDYWSKIPTVIYLLIFGIALIIYCIYNQNKINNKK